MKTANISKTLILGMAVSLCGTVAFAQTDSTGSSQTHPMNMATHADATTSSTDDHFVTKAAQGGMAEVELGKLAEQKASNPEVKKFAERMVNDHTKANEKLKEVAEKKGISLPQSLDAKDQATKQELSSLSGEQFDKAYMKDMVKDHTKDVSEFRQESTSAKDPAIKNFASETLPTLESHLNEAKKIEPQVMKSQNQ